jgi:hypothetical protein
MIFPEDSSLGSHKANDSSYAYQALAALLLLHQSFVIRVEKLETALQKGTITTIEYDAWLSCLTDLKSGWELHEISTTDDILFLQLLAQHNMQDAMVFAVA